ncbi:hypothetical protein AT1219_190002 [Vibrio alginolyticus]
MAWYVPESSDKIFIQIVIVHALKLCSCSFRERDLLVVI